MTCTKRHGRAADAVFPSPRRRHGWGCEPDPEKAITYLTAAASNSAAIEQLALEAGMKKGGAAKGELVMAIFELGNCFRYGWGIKKDSVAARQVSLDELRHNNRQHTHTHTQEKY